LAFRVEVTAHAQRDLAGLPPKQRLRVLEKIQIPRESPFSKGKVIRRLRVRTKAGEALYRLRAGDYRIIYLIKEEQVFILMVVHRKDFDRAIKELSQRR
jgi:mRNA-degrading endonuclease RelE of RelBE toxin-antitoxin system